MKNRIGKFVRSCAMCTAPNTNVLIHNELHFFPPVIKVDLKHPDLITGKSYLERVKRALGNEAFTNLTLQFFWDPPSHTTICPSSAAKYFNDCNYTVNLCSTKVTTFKKYSLKCPKFEPENFKNADIAHELVEYVSMQMLSCDTDGDEILNSYCNKVEVDEINVAQIMHCKGFFSATFIDRLVDVLRKSDIDLWLSVYIHGFEYSPLAFFNKEHSFSTNGDNSFMMFFYPNNRYLMYQNCSSNKLKN